MTQAELSAGTARATALFDYFQQGLGYASDVDKYGQLGHDDADRAAALITEQEDIEAINASQFPDIATVSIASFVNKVRVQDALSRLETLTTVASGLFVGKSVLVTPVYYEDEPISRYAWAVPYGQLGFYADVGHQKTAKGSISGLELDKGILRVKPRPYTIDAFRNPSISHLGAHIYTEDGKPRVNVMFR
jgi:hypothetical protein